MTFRCSPLLLAAMALTPVAARAQADNEGARTPAQVTATDYARAEALIGWNARELRDRRRGEPEVDVGPLLLVPES